MTTPTPTTRADLVTAEQAAALLVDAPEGPWQADGAPQNRIVWSSADNRVCFMAHSNGLNDDRDIATSNLVAAAPDLARTVIALHEALAAAYATIEKRNEEIMFERDISGEMSDRLSGKIMVWPDANSEHFGTWSTTRYPEHAAPFVPETQIEQPYEPGSFAGDIWFGHPVKRTMGTHRWDGASWQELPSEMEAALRLLAAERALRVAAEARVLEQSIIALPIFTLRDPDDAYGVNSVDYVPRKAVLTAIRAALKPSKEITP